MTKKVIRSSITAIHGDLTFSKQDVYLWVKISGAHYEFKTNDEREELVNDFSLALASVLNSDENELEGHLIVTSKVFDTIQWRDNFHQALSHSDKPDYFEDYTAKMANILWSYQFRNKNVYIGINLGDRQDQNPTKSALKLPFIDKIMERLVGEVDEYIDKEELAFWEDRASLIRLSLMESNIKATHVRAEEISYIIRKSMFPAMSAPSIDELNITGSQEWGAGELETLTDGDVVNTSKWLEISQMINGEIQTGYRATICLVKFPEVTLFPEKEPWIHSLSTFDFPIDVSSRFSIVPSQKVKKQVGNKIQGLKDQATNMTSAGGQLSLEVEENMRLGQYLEYALSKDDTPWLYGRHRIAVEASSVEELKARCQLIIDHYKSLGIMALWSSNDQLDLFHEALPNDRIRLASYFQRHQLGIMGAGVPAGTGGTGDQITRSFGGRDRGWIGPYIGYTTSRVVEPVFLNMHSVIDKNKAPACVIIGSPGSGKSHTAFTLTYSMVLSGVKTVYIDPKMDALPLASLPGCKGNTTVIDMNESHAGMLDPFLVGTTRGERIDLAMNTIEMLVGGKKEITSTAQAELSKAIENVLKNRLPSMNLLVEILKTSRMPDAQALGERLSLIRQMPYATLCFAERKKETEAANSSLNLNSRLTILTLFGLEMPDSETPKDSYSNRNHLAIAILFLLTSFSRKLMFDTNPGGKAIVIDEAWAITSTPQGAKMVLETARMGRSLDTALVLVSQNAGDFLGEGVTNSVSVRMAFRATEPTEISNVLKFLSLPENKPNIDVIRNLRVGECLLKDCDDRLARVFIDSWDEEQHRAFETNPASKRRNKEESAALGF